MPSESGKHRLACQGNSKCDSPVTEPLNACNPPRFVPWLEMPERHRQQQQSQHNSSAAACDFATTAEKSSLLFDGPCVAPCLPEHRTAA